MKTAVNGRRDAASEVQTIAAYCVSLYGIAAEEAACRMPDGRLAVVRRIGGQETARIPLSEEDLHRWTQFRGQFPARLWLG